MCEETGDKARKAVCEAVILAHESLYTTKGASWRQIIASLAFETKADLSLLQYFDEQDQARFSLITTPPSSATPSPLRLGRNTGPRPRRASAASPMALD